MKHLRRSHTVLRHAAIALIVWAATFPVLANWPQFRGPTGDGISTATNLPWHWSETRQVRWKTPIHGRAWSSPVIWEDQIWLTTATADGKRLSVLCVAADSGQIVRDLELFQVANPQSAHKFNSYASPTPVIEAGRIYVTFGAPGTACLDTRTGKVLWQRRDFVCNHFRGAGSSPILYRDLLLMNFDGSDHQFIVALDKHTGQTRWRQNRSIDFKDLGPDGRPRMEGDFRKAFSTPHVGLLNGEPTLISQGANAIYAYAPLTGAELWRVEERTSHSASSRPLIRQNCVYALTGWPRGQLLAIRPGTAGEVIDANARTAPAAPPHLGILWAQRTSVPKKPGLVPVGELLFMIDDGGIASCVAAATGQRLWRERIGGNYSASPIYAAGRIYYFSEEGKCTVIAANREFRKLAENRLESGFMASPAVSGNALILRTKTHLYRIEK